MYTFKYWLVALALVMWQSLNPTFAIDDYDDDTIEMSDEDEDYDNPELDEIEADFEDGIYDEDDSFKEDESIEVAKLAVKSFAKSSLALCRDNGKHVEPHASKHRKGILGRLSAYKNKIIKSFRNSFKNIQKKLNILVKGIDQKDDPEELMKAMNNIEKYSEACKKLTMKTIANLAVEELNKRKTRRRISIGSHRDSIMGNGLLPEDKMDKKARREAKREARKSRKLEKKAARRSKKLEKRNRKSAKKTEKKKDFRFWPWSKKKESSSDTNMEDDFEDLSSESEGHKQRRRSKGMAYEAMMAKQKRERAATL